MEAFKNKNQKMKHIDTVNKYFKQLVDFQLKAKVESFLQVVMNRILYFIL